MNQVKSVAGDACAGLDSNAPVIGIVVIGRNEGERLRRCLASVQGAGRAIVYVDSGSTDDSVVSARTAGAMVVELPVDEPFTAARARNAGFEAVLDARPQLEAVQFVDGDCEIAGGWLERAAARLAAEPALAVVCGRRRELRPEQSVYNRLCDIEWDTPIGSADACGGDALVRVRAFREVGGFDPLLIAGEEPELCLRLRRRGWVVERIEAEMTRHDAAMLRFRQWWKRAVRAGYAAAEGLAMYGRGHPRGRSVVSALCWAVGLPVLVLLAVWLLPAPYAAWPLFALPLAYLASIARIACRARRRIERARDAFAYAVFCVLGKWAETQGIATYAWRRATRARARLIEYKT